MIRRSIGSTGLLHQLTSTPLHLPWFRTTFLQSRIQVYTYLCHTGLDFTQKYLHVYRPYIHMYIQCTYVDIYVCILYTPMSDTHHRTHHTHTHTHIYNTCTCTHTHLSFWLSRDAAEVMDRSATLLSAPFSSDIMTMSLQSTIQSLLARAARKRILNKWRKCNT